jgi:putative transcriptional regulator
MAKKKRNAFLKLKALRVENGYTQADLAKKLGISETSYILKENGHREFTLDEAELIAKIFNKTINEAFFCA